MENTERQKTLGFKATLSSTNSMVKMAILSVMAYVLMIIDFPIPIFPAFLKLDLSDVPALIGGFALGPVAGVIIQMVKAFLHFMTNSSTGGVGSFANFLVGSALVFPAAYIYHMNKTRKNAMIGIVVGAISMAIVGAIANIYILIPFYANFMPIDAIVEMGTAVNSRIVDVPTLVLYGVTPFNLFKGIIIGAVTMLIYKNIAPLLKSK
ncbi:ECF transporter S component [Isachenkonia alkalipeptolytica]|uniref:Riboflavin transporter n=1 Tax=Isachenkonia alkalipeptolytica TaxID=2565777 RepID=A0AA43XME5_9CLOT|nr:ECF transporter S component [Isachenkonia alkalipeptolytica]NBG89380.1 ECF transporter S component [Isachenkonia alkalipeptolytica]